MFDYINKIVTIILIFILFVLSPLMISYKIDEAETRMLVLNEVTQFIDKVTDKGSITEQDLDDLYLGVNSTGSIFDVKVKRYIRAATKDEDGTVRTIYFSNDDLSILNKGDVIKVTVEEIGLSPAKKLFWSFLLVDSGRFQFSLAGAVR